MEVWRIGKGRHPLFDGSGALQHGARWNSPGAPAIYAASTFSLAVLEVLVHAQIGRLPPNLRSVRIEIPEGVERETLLPEDLPGWDRADLSVSRGYGDRWLAEARSAVLLVPSVLSPVEPNAVLNPRHPDFARIVAGPEEDLLLDERLHRLFGVP